MILASHKFTVHTYRTYSSVFLIFFWRPAFSMSLQFRFVYCIVSWGRILGSNWDKVSRVFLPAIHSHIYWRFFTSPSPPPDKGGLKLGCNVNILYGNLKSENSQDYAQKPQRNCMFINSASVADVPRPRKTTSPGLLTFVPQVNYYFQLDWVTYIIDVQDHYWARIRSPGIDFTSVPRRLFFATQQRIAITWRLK